MTGLQSVKFNQLLQAYVAAELRELQTGWFDSQLRTKTVKARQKLFDHVENLTAETKK